MPAAFILLFVLVRLAINYSRRRRGLPAPVLPVLRWRTVLWGTLVGLWSIATLTAFVALLDINSSNARGTLLYTSLAWALLLPAGLVLFLPWLVVERVTKHGNFKRAYYLSHFLLLFHRTGEPYGTASFCAALTLARRGSVKRPELDWVKGRLLEEQRGLGLFGAALALTHALEARLVKDEGRARDADDLRERARMLFGTITYLSHAAAPAPIRMFASEYLTLDAATRGEWSAVQAVFEHDVSLTTLAIRSWVRKNLLQTPAEKPTRRSRSAAKLPIALRLAERSADPRELDEAAVHRRMVHDYVALVKGERQAPRTILNLLTALDLFFDPRSPACRLAPETAHDDGAAAEIFDAIAEEVFAALRTRGAPLFAMRMHGAISARVYQRLESAVLGDLRSALAATRERTVRLMRGSVTDEWLEVSRVRSLYRRLEYTLGTAAAGAQAQAMYFNYGNFGVMLSESIPRRRPLAHAVFQCLRNEASRFQNAEALTREIKNMTVTSGVD